MRLVSMSSYFQLHFHIHNLISIPFHLMTLFYFFFFFFSLNKQWLKPNMATSATTALTCKTSTTSTGLWLYRWSSTVCFATECIYEIIIAMPLLMLLPTLFFYLLLFQSQSNVIASKKLQYTDHGQGAEICHNKAYRTNNFEAVQGKNLGILHQSSSIIVK